MMFEFPLPVNCPTRWLSELARECGSFGDPRLPESLFRLLNHATQAREWGKERSLHSLASIPLPTILSARGVYAASLSLHGQLSLNSNLHGKITLKRPDRRRAEAALWRAAKAEADGGLFNNVNGLFCEDHPSDQRCPHLPSFLAEFVQFSFQHCRITRVAYVDHLVLLPAS